MTTDEQRLRAAGFEPAQVLRMVTLPSSLGDDEMICWRSPDGRIFTEKQALEQLDEEEDDG